MALVTQVFEGDDGKVRPVKISYKNLSDKKHWRRYMGARYTSIEHPVHRLIVLVPASSTAQ